MFIQKNARFLLQRSVWDGGINSFQYLKSSYFSAHYSKVFCVNSRQKEFNYKVNQQLCSQLVNNQLLSSRTILTSASLNRKKTDFYQEDKLPIFDYGKLHPEKKRLYVFGQAAHGGLGLSALLDPREVSKKRMLFMHRPVRSTFGDTHTITDVATGYGFTLVVTKPKDMKEPVVYGTGYNHKSQLGYQLGQNPKQQKPLSCLIQFVPISLPLDKSSKVLAIAAGRGHSILSVEGKGLIAFGDNSVGQCGRKVIEDEEYYGSKYICRIPMFGSSPEHDVTKIASRFDVNVCVTRTGEVYTFGDNSNGQLGRGKRFEDAWIPKKVQGDLKGEKVVQVATNGASVLAVTVKGELFGWGANDCGQINPAQISTVHYEPIHIKLSERIGKIIDVAIGDTRTFVLNEFGNVYVWGTGYALGLGPRNLVVRSPAIVPPPLFGRNEFAPDVSVVKIAASFNFSAAVNSLGDLFTWGKHEKGCLGLGPLPSKFQYFPFKVALGGPVHKVCVGADHTVVMTRGGY